MRRPSPPRRRPSPRAPKSRPARSPSGTPGSHRHTRQGVPPRSPPRHTPYVRTSPPPRWTVFSLKTVHTSNQPEDGSSLKRLFDEDVEVDALVQEQCLASAAGALVGVV